MKNVGAQRFIEFNPNQHRRRCQVAVREIEGICDY